VSEPSGRRPSGGEREMQSERTECVLCRPSGGEREMQSERTECVL
jgi:hypothetical protein